ncbi:MAG TPA: LysM peptidoglycan-binding domain-containing protein [Flavobacterium sp.]|jgi:LysM repeat protein/lysophospholipase L1-like esterase
MPSKLLILVLALFFWQKGCTQETDSSFVEIDSAIAEPITVPENWILNSSKIKSFYAKLADLQKNRNRKINIVHIGDSHIQADMMTNATRRNLQQEFGNGGRGFVFPHSVAKTNGAQDIRFSSTGRWESYRNIYVPNGSIVGLSGIALTARTQEFSIEVGTKLPGDEFSTIKIITPENTNSFAVATDKRTIVLESKVPQKITHKIRSGEALSIIADKYNVSISALKKANNLPSNAIRAGKTLKIPTTQTKSVQVERSEFIPITTIAGKNYHFYKSDNSLEKIYLVPNQQESATLSGIVLENENPGILYHNIGVNGAKFSDYNKYPLFFSQLEALAPDLIILSLGTNESFDKMTPQNYMAQVGIFLQNVKRSNPDASILVVTPPPSQFQRKYPNTFVASYSHEIIGSQDDYAVWDLFSQLGGLFYVDRSAKLGLIGSDRVHYSKAGYEQQGILLAEAIKKGLAEFKSQAE